MKPSIECRADIEKLVTVFYEKVKKDAVIGFIFTAKLNINWPEHITIISNFWESILLDNPVYQKNAMGVHYELNKKIPLQKIHFDSWLQLFNNTVDELFEGVVAEKAKIRAKSIADLMLLKIQETQP
jgi:hemoglobin